MEKSDAKKGYTTLPVVNKEATWVPLVNMATRRADTRAVSYGFIHSDKLLVICPSAKSPRKGLAVKKGPDQKHAFYSCE